MIHFSQNSAFSRVVPSSARSSTPATPLTTYAAQASAMPLTTYSAHASAMPIFSAMNAFPFAMNAFPMTYPPAFLPTSGPMYSYSTLPPTPTTAVLPVPPTTPVLPVASSSPASDTSSSAAVLPIPSSTASLPIASSSPVPSASSASSSSRTDKLSIRNFLRPKSKINHARNALSKGKSTYKYWTPLEERQLIDIHKDHDRYLEEGKNWIQVAAQTLKRSNWAVYRKCRRMEKEEGSVFLIST